MFVLGAVFALSLVVPGVALAQDADTTTSGTAMTEEKIPAFGATDKANGWYWGSKAQWKLGTPSTWQHRGEGTRSAQWFDPASVNTAAGIRPEGTLVSPRDAASGLPTGKRQYEPVMIKKEVGARVVASGTRPMPVMMEKRDNMEEKRNEMRERMVQKRHEVMKRMITQQVERMNAMINRIAKLADRVETRIAKLKVKGIDTTKSRELLALVRTKIEEARAALASAKIAAEAVISAGVVAGDVNGDGVADATVSAEGSANISVDTGKAVREALSKSRDAVNVAHRALVDAVSSLRVALGNINRNNKATTTVEGNLDVSGSVQ